MASLHLYGKVPFVLNQQDMTPMQKLFLLTAEKEMVKGFREKYEDQSEKNTDKLKEEYNKRKKHGTTSNKYKNFSRRQGFSGT